MTELKPCPFCGGEPVLFGAGGWTYVKCRNCGAETIGNLNEAVSVGRWNNRIIGLRAAEEEQT